MKKYQIVFKNKSSELYGAYSKARYDVCNILMRSGYKVVEFDLNHNIPFLLRQIYNTVIALLVFLRMPKGSICYLQYPFERYYLRLALPLLKNRIRFVVIIHDLVECRTSNGRIKKEIECLKLFSHIVVHTENMKRLLINNGIPEDKLIVLWLFDYLVKRCCNNDFEEDVCFAGSLKKSLFLHDNKIEEIRNLKIYLYGSLDDVSWLPKNFIYDGKFEPDYINNVKGKWGLVWDGDSVEKCSGPMGKYLRINSPHKLSLYLAIKKPVIVWNESALADYIKKNKLGITIQSLDEIPGIISRISKHEMKTIEENVSSFSLKITSGQMLGTIINQLENDYNKDAI